jgi:hypothetical protein
MAFMRNMMKAGNYRPVIKASKVKKMANRTWLIKTGKFMENIFMITASLGRQNTLINQAQY